jgi:hypothetical protein
MIVFTMLEVGMVEALDLNDLETHVRYVKAKMTRKMRRTRAVTTRISPLTCCISCFFGMEAFLVVMS